MKCKYQRGMGMGWGHFPPPKPLLLTFEVTQKVYFCLCAKIESCYHELHNLNSTQWLTIGLVELETSRFLGEWRSYCPFWWLSLDIILEALCEQFWLLPILYLQREVLEDWRKEGKLFSICAYYHNLLVKVGVLHLLCSVCSCLVHAYAIGIVYLYACMYVGYVGKD